MRRGELLSLDWQNVDLKRRTAHLPDTKSGEARTVPLSTKAVTVLGSLPKPYKGAVFPLTPVALRLAFTRAVTRAQAKYREDCKVQRRRPSPSFLADVHFHDTRHYTIGPQEDYVTNQGKKLYSAMVLTPDPNNLMWGRGGFLIRGPKSPGDRTSSEGCIILSKSIRDLIAGSPSGGNSLTVGP